MCLNAGDKLNERYVIIALIGQGGFGKTYKAKDLGQPNHPLCVVKEITTLPVQTASAIAEIEQRFIREAKTLARLGEHPQIPKLFDYFQKNDKFYLILEYIDGHDLSQEIAPGKPSLSEIEVMALLRDVLEVLQVVHRQNIIHRDIKPSNLRRRKSDHKIVLLDFGAVKELYSIALTTSPELAITQAIGTPGYMPPEQQNGNPQLNSDLYALGMICIQALTGTHPRTLPSDPNTGNTIWRYSTADKGMIDINPGLEKVLNKMVRYLFSERYYSAIEALEDIYSLSNSSTIRQVLIPQNQRFSRLLLFIWPIGLVLAFLGLGIFSLQALVPKNCHLKFNDDISCGEESLIEVATLPEKNEGVKAFAQGNYQEAVNWLEIARQKLPNDPEILIYLNNAQLAVTNTPAYTIAVAAPLGNPADGGDSGKEILRGVAQAQTEINRSHLINGKGLRVMIADDYNNPNRAQQVAEALVQQPGVLGVIGHYSSDSTRSALQVYNRQDLVVISPTSTAETLTQDSSNFFRTVPRDSINASALSKYLFGQAKQSKVAVFYNPNSAYSRSLYDRFLLSFDEQGGQVVKQFDLSKPIFDANMAIAQAQARGATGLVLFPDAKVNPYAFTNALKVIRANQNRYLLAGGDSLYTTDLLQERDTNDKLVVSIPWHYLSSTKKTFTQTAIDLWKDKEGVSWRTATAYDAAIVLATALKTQSSLNLIEQFQAIFDPNIRRNYLYQSLKQSNFQTNGATGKISFELTGDRSESVVQLVKILPTVCSAYGYAFIPIEYKSAETAGLKCKK